MLALLTFMSDARQQIREPEKETQQETSLSPQPHTEHTPANPIAAPGKRTINRMLFEGRGK